MGFVKKAIIYTTIFGVAACSGYYIRGRNAESIELNKCGVAVTEPLYGFPVIKDTDNKKYVVNFNNKSLEEVTKDTARVKMKQRLEELFK